MAEWPNWHETKNGDWACHKCDNFESNETDTYQGNYASGNTCRECHTPKCDCQHMLMVTRTWLKQQGKLKPRSEAIEERRKRKEAKEVWNTGWETEGYDNHDPNAQKDPNQKIKKKGSKT